MYYMPCLSTTLNIFNIYASRNIKNYVNCKRIPEASILLHAFDLYFINRVYMGNAINNDDAISVAYDSKRSLYLCGY